MAASIAPVPVPLVVNNKINLDGGGKTGCGGISVYVKWWSSTGLPVAHSLACASSLLCPPFVRSALFSPARSSFGFWLFCSLVSPPRTKSFLKQECDVLNLDYGAVDGNGVPRMSLPKLKNLLAKHHGVFGNDRIVPINTRSGLSGGPRFRTTDLLAPGEKGSGKGEGQGGQTGKKRLADADAVVAESPLTVPPKEPASDGNSQQIALKRSKRLAKKSK